jgi:hypothetical protein
MLNQKTWRTVGAVALGCCALLAWFAGDFFRQGISLQRVAVYGGSIALLLLVVLYAVVLDIRFIQLQYKVGKRDLFKETIGSEELRREIRQGQEQHRGAKDPANPSG